MEEGCNLGRQTVWQQHTPSEEKRNSEDKERKKQDSVSSVLLKDATN